MSVAGTRRCSDSLPIIHSYNCTRYNPGDASPKNFPCHSIVSRSLLTLWKYFPVKVPIASLFILFFFSTKIFGASRRLLATFTTFLFRHSTLRSFRRYLLKLLFQAANSSALSFVEPCA